MSFLSSIFTKNGFLGLLCRVSAEVHFPLESLFIISFRSLFKLLAVILRTLTVENMDVSPANNLGLP